MISTSCEDNSPGSDEPRRFEPAPDALHGRIIAITGAGDGIGRALALSAAAYGAEVVLIGRTVSKLEEVHSRIAALKRAEASIAPLDLERAVARDYDLLAQALQSRYGRLHGLVHNAGILGKLAPIEHYDVPTWCRVLHVNLTAAFAMTQVLLPSLRASQDASIIFTGSGVGRRPRAYWGAYAVSKCGLEALSRTLADELATAGEVRVNVLNPGPVRTRMRAQAYPAEDPEHAGAAGGCSAALPLAAQRTEPRRHRPESGLPNTLASSSLESGRQWPRGSERGRLNAPTRVRSMRTSVAAARSMSWRTSLPLAPTAIRRYQRLLASPPLGSSNTTRIGRTAIQHALTDGPLLFVAELAAYAQTKFHLQPAHRSLQARGQGAIGRQQLEASVDRRQRAHADEAQARSARQARGHTA